MQLEMNDICPMEMTPKSYEALKHVIEIYNDLRVKSLKYKFFRNSINDLKTNLDPEDRKCLDGVLDKFERLLLAQQ